MNEHWQKVGQGAVSIGSTPEQVWQAACQYFLWVDENPITTQRPLTSGKTQGQYITVKHKRPYTIKALCLHCGISETYFKDISESHSKESEYYKVAERILMVIYNQNLEGAMVDMYNPIIVSKLLNMDKGTDNESKPVRIEIVQSQSGQLANSENEVLQKLDFGKLEIVKEKSEILKEQNHERQTGT